MRFQHNEVRHTSSCNSTNGRGGVFSGIGRAGGVCTDLGNECAERFRNVSQSFRLTTMFAAEQVTQNAAKRKEEGGRMKAEA